MRDLATRLFLRFRDRGDDRAFAELFDLVAPGLLRAAKRLSPDSAAAEDLVQGTFVVAIDLRGRFRSDAPVRPWLFGILAREALRTRRGSESQLDYARLLQDSGRSAPETPAAQASGREACETIMDAVERLPDPYRSVLLMHLGEELGGKEIAERTGASSKALSAAHVRVVIQRGLVRLRSALESGASFLIPTALAIGLGSRRAAAQPLDSLKLRIMGAPTHPTVGAAALTPTLLAAGVLMNKTVLLSVVVVGLTAGTALWVSNSQPDLRAESPVVVGNDVSGASLEDASAERVAANNVLSNIAPSSASIVVVTRDVEEVVAVVETVQPASEEAQRAAETLTSLLGRSLEGDAPPLHEVDALVALLAAESVIVDESVRYHKDGLLRSATVEVPGTDLRGEVRLDQSWARVDFSAPSQGGEGFFLADFSVVLKPDPDGLGLSSSGQAHSASAIFQHHPNCSEPPESGMEPLTCGWSYRVSTDGTSVTELSARSAGDGGSWILGSVQEESTLLEGACHLSPFDAWAAKLGPILSQ